MKLVHDNYAIECISADIVARKFTRSAYLDVHQVGPCVSWKGKRNCEAVIAKELDPKQALHNRNSLLELHTKLEAENIYVIVNSTKNIDTDVSNKSGRHKAAYFTTTFYTYAEITKQIPSIPRLIPPVKVDLIESKEK